MGTILRPKKNYGFKNKKITQFLHDIDLTFNIMEINIKHEPSIELIAPEVNMLDFEIIQDPDFETSELDLSGKSVASLHTGYDGKSLQVENLKLSGSISDGAKIKADGLLMCDNCFGQVEAETIIANNIGTLKNQKKDKDKMNIIAKRDLFVHGKSYFAFVEAWNARFEGLVRSCSILIGRSAIFNDIGNGTHIELNPLKTYLFANWNEQLNYFKTVTAELKKEKDLVYRDCSDLKVTIERKVGAEINNIPAVLRERIRDTKQTYDALQARFNEFESFFVNRYFEERTEKIERMKKFSTSDAYEKSAIYIKGSIEPYVKVTIKDKTIELDEHAGNIKLFLKGDKIQIENIE